MAHRLRILAKSLQHRRDGEDEIEEDDGEICPDNKTMFEGFEWYSEADQNHWKRLISVIPSLKAIGIDNIWIPPGCKASSPRGNGYDIYDLYDLGEFDQKGSRATKWGSKEDLVELCRVAKENGIGIYWDAVLNHKAGADYTERLQAIKVHPRDRRKEIGRQEEIEAWTGFDFPGRNNKYSVMKYNWKHFSGIDYDASRCASAIYKFVGQYKAGFASDVDDELGNYDFLMFADIDYRQLDVRENVLHWGTWIVKELGLAGMRLDAIKHYSQEFQQEFTRHIHETCGQDFFFVGEYWTWDSLKLNHVLSKFNGRISLFDVQLVHNFSAISRSKQYDLRKVFDHTLVQLHPNHAVTFVANHDTQEFQSLAAPVSEWFVAHAYALILLRADGGYPCVFYGDIYGTKAPRSRRPACAGKLARLIAARKLYAYGPQRDYMNQADCIGFTRLGLLSRANGAGLAVIMSNSMSKRIKKMFVGRRCVGEKWTDLMGRNQSEVLIDDSGWGGFPVNPRSMGVWTNADAVGRAQIDELVHNQIPWDANT